MIVFDLQCRVGGEVFEAWFSSGADFDEQSRRGLVQCPTCGSSEVEKAPMAPRVSRARAEEGVKAAAAHLAALQSRMLENSNWVGDEFPEQARAMYLGEIEPRTVHGQASPDEAKSLIEEGVPVLPLPLPVVPPGQVN